MQKRIFDLLGSNTRSIKAIAHNDIQDEGVRGLLTATGYPFEIHFFAQLTKRKYANGKRRGLMVWVLSYEARALEFEPWSGKDTLLRFHFYSRLERGIASLHSEYKWKLAS